MDLAESLGDVPDLRVEAPLREEESALRRGRRVVAAIEDDPRERPRLAETARPVRLFLPEERPARLARVRVLDDRPDRDVDSGQVQAVRRCEAELQQPHVVEVVRFRRPGFVAEAVEMDDVQRGGLGRDAEASAVHDAQGLVVVEHAAGLEACRVPGTQGVLVLEGMFPEAVAGPLELASQDDPVVPAVPDPGEELRGRPPVPLGIPRRVEGSGVRAVALPRARPGHDAVLPVRIVEAGVTCRRVVEDVVPLAPDDPNLDARTPPALRDRPIVPSLQEDANLPRLARVEVPAEVRAARAGRHQTRPPRPDAAGSGECPHRRCRGPRLREPGGRRTSAPPRAPARVGP